MQARVVVPLLGLFLGGTWATDGWGGTGVHQRTPLTEVLERAALYVAEYEKTARVLVAEEDYLQEVKTGARDARGMPPVEELSLWSRRAPLDMMAGGQKSGPKRRRLRSDFLMVQLPDRTWFGFRDVIEVDGKRVRNREGRLQELFVKSQSDATRIADESARYNIGPIQRNINLPSFALRYLSPRLQSRFAFRQLGEEPVEGVHAWLVGFGEIGTRFMVTDRHGRGVPSSGRFWIDPSTGHVLETELVVGDASSNGRGRIIVLYRQDASLGMLVPARMKELYDLPPRPWDPYVECTASYSNYRRFQVLTDTKIAPPK